MHLLRFVFPFSPASYHAHYAVAAAAQTKTFEPKEGQLGKDVVWHPTSSVLVKRMLDMVAVTPNDTVIDLGSGDGRTVIAAAKRGARALGVEYNPDMVELCRHNAASEGVGERAQFIKADLFDTDLSHATVITMFLLPDINLKLRPKILALRPGTRVVSNSFDMGDWQCDETVTIDSTDDCIYWCVAHMWIVPARVEGQWTSSAGDITLRQHFQKVSGIVSTNAGAQALNGTLRGDEIGFGAGGVAYTGRVSASSIEGTVTAEGRTSRWTAVRAD
ncbi:MAG: class I SAM-dependent methyltransferase [Pseudomonadota bacterium]